MTFNAKPLDQGSIQFSPEQERGGIFAGALIVDGRYEIARGKGLPPGIYTVRISAAIPDSIGRPKGPRPSLAKPLKERVPAKYNATSELKAEVKAGGGNVFDFTLTDQPSKGR